MAIGLALGLACLIAPAAHGAKFTTITETKGAGGSLGGVPLAIPDGAGEQTQLVRSGIPIKQLNPRGKITDVDVAVRATHPQARDLEIYLATPRGVINLSSDNGGMGNNYGTGAASCGGFGTVFDSNVPTLISTPGLTAPFAGTFAPEEPLDAPERARRQEGLELEVVAADRGRQQRQPGGDARLLGHHDQGDEPEAEELSVRAL